MQIEIFFTECFVSICLFSTSNVLVGILKSIVTVRLLLLAEQVRQQVFLSLLIDGKKFYLSLFMLNINNIIKKMKRRGNGQECLKRS